MEEDPELDREVEEVTGPMEEPVGRASPQSSDNTELIQPNDVLKALRAYVEDNRQPPKYAEQLTHCGLVTLIWVNIDSGNGLLPVRR